MYNMDNVVKVGIADMNVVKVPGTIRTAGLGSCVGAILYSQEKGIAGMVHVMLPESSLSKTSEFNKAKYGDTAIEELIKMLEKQGVRASTLKAKIAGGAQMFQFSSTALEVMRIGLRNTEAVKEQLKRFRIPIVAQDTGGNSGRTIEFDPKTCMLSIRTVDKGTREI